MANPGKIPSRVVHTLRNLYSSTNVTTSVWVELLASTDARINFIRIFDSSGQVLILGTGLAGAEVNLMSVFPGGTEIQGIFIRPATRIAIKAVSGTANQGEIDIDLFS